MKPKVMLAATNGWYTTAQLAIALSKAGFEVEAICPANHPLTKVRVVERTYRYRPFMPIRSFRHAIQDGMPDLIVPGDDLATRQLHRLHQSEQLHDRNRGAVSSLIERSLGDPKSFMTVYTRASFIQVAEEEGVRVPKTAVCRTLDDLGMWEARIGYPAVLKADGTSGGEGVRVVHSREDARRVFNALQAPPLLARATKRALMDKDASLVLPSLKRQKAALSVQSYVNGREATSATVCWNGTVLAALHFEVIKKRDAAGPATVLRLIDNPDMTFAAKAIVKRLNLSGVHGFDFMLEEGTEDAYLIEINPRATQVGHLTFGSGRDLPAALISIVTGQAISPAPKVTTGDTVALFPQEWLRDPSSGFIRNCYHDVPWEEPELVRTCLRKRATIWKSRIPLNPALTPAPHVRSEGREKYPPNEWVAKQSKYPAD